MQQQGVAARSVCRLPLGPRMKAASTFDMSLPRGLCVLLPWLHQQALLLWQWRPWCLCLPLLLCLRRCRVCCCATAAGCWQQALLLVRFFHLGLFQLQNRLLSVQLQAGG
jgi:hypothetical protein